MFHCISRVTRNNFSLHFFFAYAKNNGVDQQCRNRRLNMKFQDEKLAFVIAQTSIYRTRWEIPKIGFQLNCSCIKLMLLVTKFPVLELHVIPS